MTAPTATRPPVVLCGCGCGEPTRIAPRSYSRSGVVRGQPYRFVYGHNTPRPRSNGEPDRGPWATVCVSCPWPLVPQTAGEVPPGWRRHVARGLCDPCWSAAARGGRLPEFERSTYSRDDLLDEWDLLRSQGCTRREAARRLGLSIEAFDRALYRARADGDERAVMGVR